MLRFFGRTRYKMLCALIVVGLLVPAMPMAAMADMPEFNASLTAVPATVTVVSGDLLTEAPAAAPLSDSNLAVRLQSDEGWTWWGEVDVEADPETEANVQMWFEDSAGDWYNLVTQGFRPAGVFEIEMGYDETTQLYVLGDTPGTYTVTLNLYIRDEFDGLVDTATVTVVVQEGPEEEPVEEPEEEPVEEVAPGLPTTGLGPDRSAPWQAGIVVSLALCLAFSARRRNSVSFE